jgi:hypothetical protein
MTYRGVVTLYSASRLDA